MLLAEIHCKIVREALDNEDYITSAVFGHLRYIPPGAFWASLFTRARGAGPNLSSLAQRLSEQGIDLKGYESLEVMFWPNHRLLGQPDLILRFSGNGRPSVCIVIEVKLWSLKGGSGGDDQLGRYLRLLARLPELGVPFSEGDYGCLIYLTPRDSRSEIEDSLDSDPELEHDRGRIFRLQWQDILDMARECQANTTGWSRTILRDVSRFLQRRNLEYFRGFRTIPDLPRFGTNDREFYFRPSTQARLFRGWTLVEELEHFEVRPGGWIR